MGPIGPFFCLFWYQKHKYTCFFEKGHVKNSKKRPLPGRPEESWPNWFLPQNPKSHQIEIWIAGIEATHLISPPAPFFIHFGAFGVIFWKKTKKRKKECVKVPRKALGSSASDMGTAGRSSWSSTNTTLPSSSTGQWSLARTTVWIFGFLLASKVASAKKREQGGKWHFMTFYIIL